MKSKLLTEDAQEFLYMVTTMDRILTELATSNKEECGKARRFFKNSDDSTSIEFVRVLIRQHYKEQQFEPREDLVGSKEFAYYAVLALGDFKLANIDVEPYRF